MGFHDGRNRPCRPKGRTAPHPSDPVRGAGTGVASGEDTLRYPFAVTRLEPSARPSGAATRTIRLELGRRAVASTSAPPRSPRRKDSPAPPAPPPPRGFGKPRRCSGVEPAGIANQRKKSHPPSPQPGRRGNSNIDGMARSRAHGSSNNFSNEKGSGGSRRRSFTSEEEPPSRGGERGGRVDNVVALALAYAQKRREVRARGWSGSGATVQTSSSVRSPYTDGGGGWSRGSSDDPAASAKSCPPRPQTSPTCVSPAPNAARALLSSRRRSGPVLLHPPPPPREYETSPLELYPPPPKELRPDYLRERHDRRRAKPEGARIKQLIVDKHMKLFVTSSSVPQETSILTELLGEASRRASNGGDRGDDRASGRGGVALERRRREFHDLLRRGARPPGDVSFGSREEDDVSCLSTPHELAGGRPGRGAGSVLRGGAEPEGGRCESKSNGPEGGNDDGDATRGDHRLGDGDIAGSPSHVISEPGTERATAAVDKVADPGFDFVYNALSLRSRGDCNDREWYNDCLNRNSSFSSAAIQLASRQGE